MEASKSAGCRGHDGQASPVGILTAEAPALAAATPLPWNGHALAIARAHLGWLRQALAGRACVVGLADGQGRLLQVEASCESLPAELGLVPGACRAEGAAAACLAAGRLQLWEAPVPVLGWAGPTEWALPLRDRDCEVIGVLLLAMDSDDAPAGLALLLEHVGWSIERELTALSGRPLWPLRPEPVPPHYHLVDDVLRVIAHDMRNPLSVIMLGAGVLTVKGADSNDPKLESILLAAERMEQLIRNLTDLTALTGGTRRLRRQAASLHGLLQEAVRQPSVRALERQVVVDDDGSSPLVRVEPALAVQALAGLMATAAALGSGPLQWRVRTDARRVRLTVAAREGGWDEAWTGLLELPLREREQIVPGAGLGYALAAAIAAAHEGTVGWARQGDCALALTLPTVAPREAPISLAP